MSKKNKNIFIIISLILIATFTITKIKLNHSISFDHFAVKDTSVVHTIILTQQTDTLLLERKENKWLINNSWKAKEKTIKDFLSIVKRIEIKTPLSHEVLNKYKDQITNNGVYVQIRNHSKSIVHYAIYEEVQETINTFLFDPEKDQLFLIKIPGKYGKLSGYFSPNLMHWKDNVLIHLQPFEIESVEVLYSDANKSFTVKRDTGSTYSLYNIDHQRLYSIPKKIDRYLTYFQHIEYVYELNPFTLQYTHLIASIYIEHINGLKYQFELFRIPALNQNQNIDYDINFLLIL